MTFELFSVTSNKQMFGNFKHAIIIKYLNCLPADLEKRAMTTP